MMKLLKYFLGLGLATISISSFADCYETKAPTQNPVTTTAQELLSALNTTGTPVIKEDDTIYCSIPLEFSDETADDFQKVIDVLNGVKNKHIVIKDQGFGGDVMLVNKFSDAILTARRNGNTVTADVYGPAASGHAFFTCYVTNVVLEPGSSLLYHQAYGMVAWGRGYIEYRQYGDEPIVNALMNAILQQCKTQGSLTDKDIKTIKNGDDVIIYNENNVLNKIYTPDGASVKKYTIPMLLHAVVDTAVLFWYLIVAVYIIRKVGK